MSEFTYEWDLYQWGDRAYEDCKAIVVLEVPDNWKAKLPNEDEIIIKSVTVNEDTKKYLKGFHTDLEALYKTLKDDLSYDDFMEAMGDHLEALSETTGLPWDFDSWYGVV